MASQIDNAYTRAWGLFYIAQAQAEAGDLESARRIFNNAFHSAQQIDGTYTWLQQIDINLFHYLILEELAIAQARAGYSSEAKATFDSAVHMAQQTENIDFHPFNVAGIATAQAKSGNFIDGMQTAQSIHSNYRKARSHALANIAKALAEQ